MVIDEKQPVRIVLFGAGIMSATLGVLLKKIIPYSIISIYERLPTIGSESSDAWNNAGTGHSAFCELNYTPQKEDGTIDISKALKIASQFEVSKQFWSYLVKNNYIPKEAHFINKIPHISFVWGKENCTFLHNRYQLLTQHNIFKHMEYSNSKSEIENWIPLTMLGRTEQEEVAATKMDIGTDVNFGVLTRSIIQYLDSTDGVEIVLDSEIKNIEKCSDDKWEITVKNNKEKTKEKVLADFVFIGAGGGSLPLLEKADIDEAEGYGGFPISGQWLRCINEEVIQQHNAKVYGKASVGAPPMSVPHLDTRFINGKKELLFGPFAGFSTKFLKNGSYLDLPLSVELDNIIPMLSAGIHNIPLTKYLVQQVTQTHQDRVAQLKEYFPNAKPQDWVLEIAGQRVQVIKKDEEGNGVLEFGTEIVTSADGTIAALLGASPGASTAVSVMLDVIKKCFPEHIVKENTIKIIQEMIPSYGTVLKDNDTMCTSVRQESANILGL